MKIKLSKVATLLLVAAVFAVPSCKDYSADIESVKKDVSSQSTQIASLESQLSTLNSTVTTLQSNVTTLQSEVSTLKTQKTELENKLNDVTADVATIKSDIAKLDTRIKADEDKIAAAEAAIKLINDETIPALKQLIAQNADDINGIKTTVGAMELAIKALEAKDTVIIKMFDDYVLTETFTTFIQANEAKLAAKVDTAAMNAEVAVLEAAIAAGDTALQGQVDSIKADIASFEGRITELEYNYNLVKDNLFANGIDINKLGDVIAALKSSISELETAVAALRLDVDGLLDQVQSLVFVPEYTDGCATYSYLYNNDKAFAAATTLTYEVKPAKLADSLALAYAKDPSAFSFKVISVKTRAAEDGPALAIQKISATGDGLLSIAVKPVDLVSTQNYAAAFQLSNNKTDISSEYVNLVADIKKVKLARFAKVAADGTVSPITLADYPSFEYLNTDVHNLYEGVEAVFADEDSVFYSRKQLLDTYMIPEEDIEITYVAIPGKKVTFYDNTDPQNPVYKEDSTTVYSLFKFSEPAVSLNVLPVSTVALDASKTADERRAAIDYLAYVDYAASSQGVMIPNSESTEPFFNQALASVTRVIIDGCTLASEDINWTVNTVMVDTVTWTLKNTYNNFNYDISQDATLKGMFVAKLTPETAAKFAEKNIKTSDFAQKLPVEAGVYADEAMTVPAGVDIKTILMGHGNPDPTKDSICVNLEKIKWGKTYYVKAKYNTEYNSVVLKTSVKTIDRPSRDLKPVITLPDTTFVLDKDATLVYAEKAYVDTIWQYYLDNGGYSVDICEPEHKNMFVNVVVNNANNKLEITDKSKHCAVTYPYIPETKVKFFFDKDTLASDAVAVFANKAKDTVTLKKALKIDPSAYQYKHTAYVSKDGDTYFSQVVPIYRPSDGKVIFGYDLCNIDLDQAFELYKNGVKVSDMFGEHLSATWALGDGEDVVIGGNRYVVYSDTTKKVYLDVHPKVKLKVETANPYNPRFTIPTAFDADSVYNSYVVKRFVPYGGSNNPITIKDAVLGSDGTPEIQVQLTTAGEIIVDLFKYVQYSDNRYLGTGESYHAPLIDNNEGWFTEGDGNALTAGGNGFTQSTYSATVYQGITGNWNWFTIDYAKITPASLASSSYISIWSNSKLSFRYNSQMQIYEDVVVPMTVEFNNPWANESKKDTLKFNVRFKKPVIAQN